MTRIALGFVIAPLLPALVAFALEPFVAAVSGDSNAGMVLLLSVFSPLFAVPALLVFAVPLFVWFRRRNWLRLHHALLGGAIVGCATALAFAVYDFLTAPNFYHWSDDKLFVHWRYLTEPLSYAIVFIPYGVVMAAIFWVVAYWKRTPDITPASDARAG